MTAQILPFRPPEPEPEPRRTPAQLAVDAEHAAAGLVGAFLLGAAVFGPALASPAAVNPTLAAILWGSSAFGGVALVLTAHTERRRR